MRMLCVEQFKCKYGSLSFELDVWQGRKTECEIVVLMYLLILSGINNCVPTNIQFVLTECVIH